eukprot:Lankesteria_metandrocarpae@DN2784_c0_g1_i1.p1
MSFLHVLNVLSIFVFISVVLAEDIVTVADTDHEQQPPVVKVAVPFVEPAVAGLHFAETFDENWGQRWIQSGAEKFTGTWKRVLRSNEAIEGDYGLRMMDANQHHAIASELSSPFSPKDSGFVVSYEVKYETLLACGGSYIKLFDSAGMDMAAFDNETPYLVMFGPDKCGSKSKVHFIIRQKLPSGKWTEHHLIDPPQLPSSPGTHVYTLRVNSDDSFEILIDQEVKSQGTFATRFDPSFTPEAEIADPDDKKPEDWVDNERMSDPDAVKPEDWDEDAPPQIPDSTVQKPEGWLDDEPLEVEDGSATQPAEWDDEMDGAWKRPTVPNPKCSGEEGAAPGCGEWSVPLIANVEYKGRWSAPMIENPNYKGVWAPRTISNPDYFEAQSVHALSGSNIDAVGFELWTVNEGMLYDNIVLSKDYDSVKNFIDNTYKIRAAIEAEQITKDAANIVTDNINTPSLKDKLSLLMLDQPALAVGTFVISMAVVLWLMWKMMSLCLGSRQPVKQVKKVSDDEKKIVSEESEEEKETEKENVVHKEAETARGTRRRQGKPATAD